MADMTMFRVTYDGPALATHQMDARDLAPALLAVADLLEASSRALYGDKAKPQVNVRGSFKTGSFNIDFAAAIDWIHALRDMFAGQNAAAIANGLAILSGLGFIGKKGLTQVLKWLRGRRITRVEILEESGIIYVDDDFMVVELETITLLQEVAVRNALDRVLSPLDRDGIDTFAVGNDSEVNVTIDESERAFFAPPESFDDLILDDVRKMIFSIVSLAFKEDNKWRLSDGSATINAIFSDAEFLSAVDQNLESFSKGDVLICDVRVRQWQTASGAKTDYEVIKVIEHRRAARQIPLPGIDRGQPPPSTPPSRRPK